MNSPSVKTLIPLAILLGGIAFTVFLIYSKPPAKQSSVVLPPMLIDALEAQKQDIQITVKAQGAVTPRTETELISEVSGQVIKVATNFIPGGFFQKGDVLLRIDDRNYQAAVKKAQAAVASARSNIALEKGRAEVAYKEWKTIGKNVKRSDIATQLALRKPQLADVQANLDFALADLERIKGDLERTIIKAPYDGLVKSKNVDVGQYVSTGSSLANTFAVDYAEVRLAIPENKLAYLELSNTTQFNSQETINLPAVRLSAEIGGTEHQWNAQLVRSEGIFDERSRVLFVVARIKDPYNLYAASHETLLRIGTFVDAVIEGKVINNLVVLPRYLLRAGNKIWIVDDNNLIQDRKVKILRTGGEMVYVQDGLESGERVCSTNIPGLLPGRQVKISSVTQTTQLLKSAEQTPEKQLSTPALKTKSPEQQSTPKATTMLDQPVQAQASQTAA